MKLHETIVSPFSRLFFVQFSWKVTLAIAQNITNAIRKLFYMELNLLPYKLVDLHTDGHETPTS